MTAKAVAAVSCAVLHEGRFLLVRRGRAPSLGLYAFPGGKVEPGETAAAAAAREVMEETGIRVAPNAQEVAQAIVSLLADRERCARLGATARRRVAALHSEDRYRRYLENLHRRAAESINDGASTGVGMSKP